MTWRRGPGAGCLLSGPIAVESSADMWPRARCVPRLRPRPPRTKRGRLGFNNLT
jgi:hypothetical protein